MIAMATQPLGTQLRKTGIGVVGDIPWGTHFFMFYETKEDLLDMLVPYFKTGLETGELCLWVVSEPLTESEARDALRDAVTEFDHYLANQSIEILRGRQFYLTGNDLDLGRIIQTWAEKTALASARGYAGFRMSADTAWLEHKEWKAFSDYEKEVNDSIGQWRMTALCTYPLAGSTAAEILDVTRTHQFAIARRNRDWEVVETSELKQAKAEIKRLNDELERRVAERTVQLETVNQALEKEIAERQRAEEDVFEAQDKLARVSRIQVMAELAAAIGHEINQPLTAIVTNANFSLRQLKGSTPNHDELRTAIMEIVDDGTRASSVLSRIRDLLVHRTPGRVPLDINLIIRDVTAIVRNELNRSRISLRTELAPDLPPVPGDPVQLQQVLINLVMNAIEALRTSPQSPRKLLIRSVRKTGEVLVQIQDSGPGIKSAEANRIFEPFFTTKPEGTGMGLSICNSIVESHGGRLRTVPNSAGALFEFTLPTNGAIAL